MLFVFEEHRCSSFKEIWLPRDPHFFIERVAHNALFVLYEHTYSSLKKTSRVARNALFVLDEHT